MDELEFDSEPPKLDELPEFRFPVLNAGGRTVPGADIAVTEAGDGSVIVAARSRRGQDYFAAGDEFAAGVSSGILESLMFWTTRTATGYRVASGKAHYIRFVDSVWRRITADIPQADLTTSAVNGYVYLRVPFETQSGGSGSSTGAWTIEGSSYTYQVDYTVQYHGVLSVPGISVDFSTGVRNHGDLSCDWYLLAEVVGGEVLQKHVGNILILQSSVPVIQQITVT